MLKTSVYELSDTFSYNRSTLLEYENAYKARVPQNVGDQ
jgi:hypothetical protein